MSDYTGSSFISAPVEDELTGLTTLINENKDANSATQALLDQEIYDREQADITLQNQINGAATAGALTAEVTARTDADTELGVRITDNTNALGTTNALLDQEVLDRENADINLQNQINPLATQTSLNNEVNTRIADDLALGVRITDNTTLIGTTRTELAQEITDRTTADTALENDINDRALTLSLNNEITARTNDDNALGVRIDFEKTTTAYYIQGLQGQIDVNETAITAEETARTNADAGLQTAINTNASAITAEESARQTADSTLQDSIATNATAITAEETARTNADSTLQTTKANLDGGNTFTGEQDINGYAKIDRVMVQAVSNDYPPFRVTNSFSSFTSAQIDADKNALLVRSNTTLAGDSIISAYNNSKNDIVFKVGGDGKLTTKAVEADGDVNLTAGKAYKINDVIIPTHDDLALKAPIDNANLTGNTTMTRLTVNHSDSASIGLDFNNTNNNQ